MHHQLYIRQLPKSINKRISFLSSDKPSFESAVPLYEDAQKQSNFNTSLRYENETNSSKPKKRTRSRNILWYNPPCSKNVKTKVTENFLRLIDKHFPKSSNLPYIKLQYSKHQFQTTTGKFLRIGIPPKFPQNRVTAELKVNVHWTVIVS